MIWRDLKGFESLYHISEYGDIVAKPRITWNGKCLVTRKVRRINSHKNRDGYMLTPLTNIGVKKQIHHSNHRLVAITFLEQINGKDFVNHKDGNKSNNYRDNLEWCTKSENSKHSFTIGLQCNKGQHNPKSKFTNEDVMSIRKRYANGESSWKIYKDIGGSYTNIKDIIAKRTWSHI